MGIPRVVGRMLLAAGVGLLGCATPDARFTGVYSSLKSCRDRYAEIDARIDAAGVRDAEYYRVPGYPYLRTDRLLASYSREVTGVNQVGGWLRRMHELDQEAREYEYMNLGLNVQNAAILRFDLLNCGRGLIEVELDGAEALRHLQAIVTPPDQYSDLTRSLGLYPLAVVLIKDRLAAHQEQVRREFSQPLTELKPDTHPVRWQAEKVEDPELIPDNFDNTVPDELGLPGLVDSAWRAIVEAHAPQLWIETGGDQDVPGAPVWDRNQATVDASLPSVYYQIDFTRFGGRGLVRINYFAWFRGGTPVDGGSIDGLVWRVTLDANGNPLVYESLHPSGRDHRWFPAQPLARRPQDDFWHEPAFFPQEQLAPRDPILRLESDSHELSRILKPEQLPASAGRSYKLRRYEDLYTLPRPDGTTRSLFDPEGLIQGSHSVDPVWLWSTGLSHPGTLRQLGHLATAYVGRSEFDDPFLMEQVFVPPKPPVAVRAASQPAS